MSDDFLDVDEEALQSNHLSQMSQYADFTSNSQLSNTYRPDVNSLQTNGKHCTVDSMKMGDLIHDANSQKEPSNEIHSLVVQANMQSNDFIHDANSQNEHSIEVNSLVVQANMASVDMRYEAIERIEQSEEIRIADQVTTQSKDTNNKAVQQYERVKIHWQFYRQSDVEERDKKTNINNPIVHDRQDVEAGQKRKRVEEAIIAEQVSEPSKNINPEAVEVAQQSEDTKEKGIASWHDIPGPAGGHIEDNQPPHQHRKYEFNHSLWRDAQLKINSDPHFQTLELCNIADVLSCRKPKRWNMLINIAEVSLIAGEMDIVVNDASGEMCATIDRRCVQKWRDSLCRGALLLVVNVMALPSSWQQTSLLLVLEGSLLKVF